MVVITTMEKFVESGRFYAKNGNIIILKKMVAVLCLHADLTTETIKKRKFKWMLVHGMMDK